MTYAEKIKELQEASGHLMAEYRIIAHEINLHLRQGIPVEQEMIRLQHVKQQQFTIIIAEYKSLLLQVTRENVLFTDNFEQEKY